jgi:hypothetical protein
LRDGQYAVIELGDGNVEHNEMTQQLKTPPNRLRMGKICHRDNDTLCQ